MTNHFCQHSITEKCAYWHLQNSCYYCLKKIARVKGIVDRPKQYILMHNFPLPMESDMVSSGTIFDFVIEKDLYRFLKDGRSYFMAKNIVEQDIEWFRRIDNEVTYSIGDMFVTSYENNRDSVYVCILTYGEHDNNVRPIWLHIGRQVNAGIEVSDVYHITEEEMQLMFGLVFWKEKFIPIVNIANLYVKKK